MAPNFFSKLVKSPVHSRDRSSESATSAGGGGSGRKRTASTLSTNGAPESGRMSISGFTVNNGSGFSGSTGGKSAQIPTIVAADNVSEIGSVLTGVNVTVVPPSPQTTTDGDGRSLPPEDETPKAKTAIDSFSQSMSNGNNRDRTTSSPAAPIMSLPKPRSRPPTPVRPTTPVRSRPTTPASSTANLPVTANGTNPPPVPKLTAEEIRHSASNRSLKGPAPVDTSAVSRVPNMLPSSENTSEPIYESPTTARASEFPRSMSPEALPQANGLTTPPRDNSDAISFISTAPTTATSKKRKPTAPWKRERERKPTGLASAIAASGLAMANPGMSPPHHAQLSPPVTNVSPPGSRSGRKSSMPSPPRITRTSSSGAGPMEMSSRSKRRTGSISVQGDNVSEYGAGYYSGLEDDSDEDDDSDSDGGDDLMDLDFGEDDIPVTGFAVASSRRNADFHELFPTIPEGDYLIEDYGCALQREILIQGRLYISENHICFHANIFGWITDLSVPIHEIITLEKKMTAFVIPNAIQITTRQNKYSFASFLSRDTTFDVIFNIWRLARPSGPGGDSGSVISRQSMDQIVEGTIMGQGEDGIVNVVGKVKRKVTHCACGQKGEHYSETALETIFPGTPDRIHNLIFASGFMKDFLAVNQKLIDIQVADWVPLEPGSQLLARNMSYIKPLSGSVGPKQTKCEIRDETIHSDFEDYICTLTTTRNPDVPSGGVFSVKTRTCIMWASAVSSKVIVTTQVEWTGRSFIKGIIERSAIEGQKVYHADLETAMRVYITEHQSEFIPEGIDPDVIAAAATPEPTTPIMPTSGGITKEEENKRREKERNQRSLQWAWDTFDGAYQVAVRSTKGALELVRDAWDQSTSTTILIFVIVLLVFSNLYTLTRMGSKEEDGRRKELKRLEEREVWIQGVVTALWDEMAAGKGAGKLPYHVETTVNLPPVAVDWRQEISVLQHALDDVEARANKIRAQLHVLQNLPPEETLD